MRSADKIEFCPYCSRILYYEEIEGADEQFRKSLSDVEIEEGGWTSSIREFDDLL